jgi:integrase
MKMNWKKNQRVKLQREPLPFEAIKKWCKDTSTIQRLTKAAIVIIGFRAMLRPSEIVNLKIDSIKIKEGRLSINLGITKTDRTGDDDDDTIIEGCRNKSICPVQLFNRYMSKRRLMKVNSESLFILNEKPINYSIINKIVKEIASAMGINKGISGHSIRIGGATRAALVGISEMDIMTIGRWKSDAFRRYIRSISVGNKGLSDKLLLK